MPAPIDPASRPTLDDRSWNVDRLGSRVIRDASGVAWTVQEVSQPSGYDARRRRSLVFTSKGVMRRFWSYPENWTELSEADLFELSRGR